MSTNNTWMQIVQNCRIVGTFWEDFNRVGFSEVWFLVFDDDDDDDDDDEYHYY